ncbi:MAG: TonB family protein [Gemmatimonadetes bacterium]|nr:TonB family protein [Gemmatimonadota bacterium]
MGNGRDQRSVAWGLVLSVGLHVVFLPLLGRVRIPGLPHVPRQEWPLTTVRLPPAVQIPEPPAPVVRPALPLPPKVDLEGGLAVRSIDPLWVSFDREVSVPPPRALSRDDLSPSFVRYDVPPLLGNRKALGRIVRRSYPIELQRAGVEAAVVLVLYIDDRGKVGQVRVEESSGYSTLDDAAREIVLQLEFLPALMRDQLVGVWVHQRICFVLPKRDATWSPAAAAKLRPTVGGCETLKRAR